MNPVLDYICGYNASDLNPGGGCPICGHTSALHPGVHNPGLANCVICEIQHYRF